MIAKETYRYSFYVVGTTLCAFLCLSGCTSTGSPVPTQPAALIPETIENVPTQQIMPTVAVKMPTSAEILPTANPTDPAATTLSTSSLSTEIPLDIMKEIVYFGQGGGDSPCPESTPGGPSLLWLLSDGGYLKNEGGDISRFELYKRVTIGSCGWKPNEQVTVTQHFPDGRTQTETVSADEYSYTGYITHPTLDDQPGLYTLVLEGESGKLEESYELVDTQGAGFSQLEDKLLFYGFLPNESVSIYAYQPSDEFASHLSFTGWQFLQVDPEGKLEIGIEPALQEEHLIYLIIGEKTGALDSYNDPRCGNLPRSSLKRGEVARTVPGTIPSLEASLDGPQFYDRRAFSEEHTVSILDGPLCVVDGIQNGVFWLASFEDGSKYWLAELDEQSYYYLLAEGVDASQVKTATCPNAPPQRISQWDSITICTQQDKVIVRDGPQKSASEVARLAPGTEAYITDGPVCADDWSWWMIQTYDEITGWVSEGGDSIDPYYICPVE